MSSQSKIIGIIIMLIGIIIFLSIIYFSVTMDLEKHEVDCFDRWDNKIIGEKCIEQNDNDDIFAQIVLGIIPLAIFLTVGMLFYHSGDNRI